MWTRFRDWSERYDQRQRDLALGFDAGLVRANKRESKVACGFFGLFLLSAAVFLWADPSGVSGWIVKALYLIGALGWMLLGLRTRYVWAELQKPDRKKPPSILDP
jgi:peptidoglycan/LPS O-acetylase OafA/YrhL